MKAGLIVFPLICAVLASCAQSARTDVAPAPVSVPATTPQESCRAEVARIANRPVADTSVISSETSVAGAAVKIGLAGAERPWSCIVGPDGVVKNAMYMGEG